ncbi:MAG TPA: 3-oxoacyl-[acyl-carrier-protein] synthase III C-terminal domain-containing protein, partial [Verrucomicrobiota bacterium]|nr:3-oxoacyl-[acyl-carrier-protein] synthase III C-terminal domain-containing protein [Verrucomicrobiota bacterium]
KWKFAASRLVPGRRDALRFEQRSGMLRNILSPAVPQFAADEAAQLMNESLAGARVPRDNVVGWVLHTGGRDVLLALRDRLGLSESDVRHSSGILREFGNISSPTVLFVLEAALKDSVPDGLWWMSSFGAGFSCHGALLEVR